MDTKDQNDMGEYDVRRLALILACQAEIEGMKAENKFREIQDQSLAYGEEAFNDKANELKNLAYAHDQQLF